MSNRLKKIAANEAILEAAKKFFKELNEQISYNKIESVTDNLDSNGTAKIELDFNDVEYDEKNRQFVETGEQLDLKMHIEFAINGDTLNVQIESNDEIDNTKRHNKEFNFTADQLNKEYGTFEAIDQIMTPLYNNFE